MTKIFNQIKHYDFQDIETIEDDNGRYYKTPEGTLPSVTTLLSKTKSLEDKNILDEWRNKIGEEEADKIIRKAQVSGTDLHYVIECFLKNEPLPAMNVSTKWMFHQIKPVLTKHITTIYAQEVPLYSKQLGFAGRVDCVAVWKDKLCIIDFKTAKKERRSEMIEDYFIQCCAYAIMYSLMTGVPVRDFVIIMVEKTGMSVQIFEGKTVDYVKKLMDRIKIWNQ